MTPRPAGARELATAYLGGLDRGEPVLDLLAADAQITFPKWGTARGHGEIRRLYGDLGRWFRRFSHNVDEAAVVQDGRTVVVEGHSTGVLRDGPAWDASSNAGRWCAIIEVAGGLITSVRVYLDPDFGQADRARYPWWGSDADRAAAVPGRPE
jgi:ketosteroid isomerase-like protein